MANVLKIYQLRIFSLEDVVKVLSIKPGSATAALIRWQQKGLVKRIRRNLYTVVDPSTLLPIVDKYEIASRVAPHSCVGWHTALEFHGLAHQPFTNAFVASDTRFANFSFNGIDFEYCRAPIDLTEENGVFSPAGNPYVKVTDVERTIIDCIDQLNRAGGVEELLHCIEGIPILDEDKLKKYLALYGKSFLYQKVGYILEITQEYTRVSDSLIKFCKSQASLCVKYLTNDKTSDKYVKEWSLYVPSVCLSKNTINYELI